MEQERSMTGLTVTDLLQSRITFRERTVAGAA
jgi:hypothetical protein